MGPGKWLRLTDYASKYHISISTLRRRIKVGDIPHRFEDGKYLIFDQTGSAKVEESEIAGILDMNAAQEKLDQLRNTVSQVAPLRNFDEPILSSANRLLSELKLAYMSILQEKEEQMIQLKEEVSDLKTLVRVLEDDNDRMRRNIQSGRY